MCAKALGPDSLSKLSQLPELTQTELYQVLQGWSQTSASYPARSTYSACFHQRVQNSPLATAVCAGGQEISYQELNGRANQLAHHLQRLGVTAETLVGLCIDRSVELAVAFLAILKAGGGFMPLDPTYPRQRLKLMVEDSKPLLILTQCHYEVQLSTGSTDLICVDAPGFQMEVETYPAEVEPRSSATAESLAYVIYTSGSTGSSSNS